MKLRDYQTALVESIERQFETRKHVLVQLATGGGKTMIGNHIAESWDGKVRVLAHRNELIDQWGQGLTIQSTVSKTYAELEEFGPNDLLIVDEAHHYVDNNWHKALENWDGYILGLTATPCRSEKFVGFEHVYQALVEGPTKSELIDKGYLVPALLKNPRFEVIEGRGKNNDGDFSAVATMQAFATNVQQRAAMTEEPIDWLLSEKPDGQTIGFCISKSHLEAVEKYATSKGIPTGVITGNTSKGVRKELLAKFKATNIRLLLTVNVLTEGVDLPICDTVLIMRPTTSLALYLQMVGRCLRVNGRAKTHGLVLDAAGNHTRFGHPDDDYIWSLRAQETDVRPPKVCVWCDAVSPNSAKTCNNCEAPFGEGGGAPRPQIKCGKCGRSRSAKVSACPYCAVTVKDADVDLSDAPIAFSHRNTEWQLEDAENLRYVAHVKDAMVIAWIAKSGDVWNGGLVSESDEAQDFVGMVETLGMDGEIKMKATASLPFQAVDKVLDRAKKIARLL